MSDTPKCTSWRGHKFEGRYSYGGVQGRNIELDGDLSMAMIERIHRSLQVQTYERDICVRCGFVIERDTMKGERGK